MGGYRPLNGNWEFPGAGNGLHNDVGLLHPAGEKLRFGSDNEGLNDGLIPSGVDNANTQGSPVVMLGGWSLYRHYWGYIGWLGVPTPRMVGILSRFATKGKISMQRVGGRVDSVD